MPCVNIGLVRRKNNIESGKTAYNMRVMPFVKLSVVKIL
jgi:hypothetical protein